MSVGDKSLLVLMDSSGKKHVLKKGQGMKQVGGLGVVDTDKLAPGNTSIAGKEFAVAEASLPDIFSCIRRGPQWIMPKDSAQIIFNCSIGPGDNILEVGTGTGALTIILAHCVGAGGKIVTYEKNEKHLNIAKHNLRMAGMEDIVEMRLADAGSCEETGVYDAIAIDMPEPWKILEPMTGALKNGGYLCAYLPTMNQVEKALGAMRDTGYRETHALENIQRELVVGQGGTRPGFEMLGHTGYLCFGRKVRP